MCPHIHVRLPPTAVEQRGTLLAEPSANKSVTSTIPVPSKGRRSACLFGWARDVRVMPMLGQSVSEKICGEVRLMAIQP
jgi:hypothetical protein